MATPTPRKSLAQIAEEASNAPTTMKDRATGAILALVFIGLGGSMWMWPGLFTRDPNTQLGRGGRKVAFWLDLFWSRPVGSVLIVLALLMILGILTKKRVRQTDTSGQQQEAE